MVKFLVSFSFYYNTSHVTHEDHPSYQVFLQEAIKWHDGYAEIVIDCEQLLEQKQTDNMVVDVNVTEACDSEGQDWQTPAKPGQFSHLIHIHTTSKTDLSCVKCRDHTHYAYRVRPKDTSIGPTYY